jgi:hypothetical protein
MSIAVLITTYAATISAAAGICYGLPPWPCILLMLLSVIVGVFNHFATTCGTYDAAGE